MPVQTSVSYDMARGFPGNHRSDTKYITGFNTEATAEIPFGCGVVRNLTGATNLANRQAVRLPAAAGDLFMGVAMRTPKTEADLGDTGSGPKPGIPFNIAEHGEVQVRVESAVVAGQRAFMRHTANGAGKTQLGIFRADADTATAVELKGCFFRHSGAAGDLVWMFVDVAATRATQA